MEAIRSMIDRIVVTPRDGGGVELELHGDLARILGKRRRQATSLRAA